jgi:hypothetical protein|tara:strand:- start:142 stop:399 length:258 start_codon:yes stop_codon:yes gene_type:complete
MAWELWQQHLKHDDSDEYDGYYRIGFFCNTSDVSFGPVMGFQVDIADYKDARDEIYSRWDNADPRCLDEDEIRDTILRLDNREDD